MDQLPFELKLTIIGMDLDKFFSLLEEAGFEQQAKDVQEQVKEILSDTTPKPPECDMPDVGQRLFHFDTWDKHGKVKTIVIEALNKDNAVIIFKAKHSELGFDEPY